ncbi:hypothetical protein THAOC_15118 [Thalassiosira oceanica]|uniref:Uncharacterized protein n=1 Tax=Thalassiosira oceanica TaxID=159749 RepID=K0SDL3_THAOC|nr:hypothetical protein THAOC_15118 [Thalassiosira oceanica]|eukprot:EJK64173.1 hypothetical protein THAOC_15118 [Thalassiosira oceanica]
MPWPLSELSGHRHRISGFLFVLAPSRHNAAGRSDRSRRGPMETRSRWRGCNVDSTKGPFEKLGRAAVGGVERPTVCVIITLITARSTTHSPLVYLSLLLLFSPSKAFEGGEVGQNAENETDNDRYFRLESSPVRAAAKEVAHRTPQRPQPTADERSSLTMVQTWT